MLALEVHPCGFYAWLSISASKRSKEDEHLLGFIKQYWLESGYFYIYRKVYKDLRATDDQCRKNLVYRLMRTEVLHAQRGYKRKNNYRGGDL
jgi:putative transposase